jgi:hypothetical protein
MGSIVYILFDFPDNRLTDRANILRLMTTLAHENDYRFLKKAIVCDDMPGDLYVPNEPELLDRAWSNAVRAAPRYDGAYWMEFEGSYGLRMNFGFDPRKLRRLNLTIDKDRLKLPTDSHNARELAHVIGHINEALHPDYGYGLFNYDIHELAPVGTGVTALWDYNLFGEALVETMGRDRFMNLPIWEKHEFADGSILLEIAENPVAGWRVESERYRVAAQALGIAKIIQGG